MGRIRKQHMVIDWESLINVESNKSAKNAPLNEKAVLVGRLGLMMLSVGAGAWRVRAAMNKISRAMNITCNADIGLHSIEYTCLFGNESYTNALSINTTGVNTGKLHHLRVFANEFESKADKYSIRQFFEILESIEHSFNQYNDIMLGLSAALSCGAFTFLLGGGIEEIICVFFGAGIGNFVRKKLLKNNITLFANVSISVAISCIVYIVLIKLAEYFFGISDAHQAGYICSMLFIIPGFPLITGGIDLAKLDLRSGFERILYAILIIFVATITGWLCAYTFKFVPADFVRYELSLPLKILFRFLASFIAVFGFSIMFNSTIKMAITAGLIGSIANIIRLELIDYTSIPIALATFISALIAGLCASSIKKYYGYPRLTITVPSIVIMVPGLYMYKGIYFIAVEDITTGILWLIKAVMIVCSLSLGLITARILTDKNFRKSS